MALKIGIIGTDSTHADSISSLLNTQNIIQNVKITHIYGTNKDETARVLSTAKIENIVSSPEEMLGKVDAVMILTRNGNTHLEYAKPFIEAKTAVWIDKPIAINYEDAEKIIELSNENNVLLMGGSCGKRVLGVKNAKQAVKNGKIGEVLFATINFPANMSSVYNGLHFYAPHLCEIALEIFGFSPKSLYAQKVSDNNITVILAYEKFNITLNFIENSNKNSIYIMATNGIISEEIDFSDAFVNELNAFVAAIKNENPPKVTNDFIMSIRMINAMYKSIDTGTKIGLN